MKAIVYEAYGSPDVLQLRDISKPVPKADEVLIKVHATTVTTGDCNMRGFVFVPPSFGLMSRLMFGIRKPKRVVLGVELAGEIEAVGSSVQRFKVGDQVFGLDGSRIGAYAEYACRTETGGLVIKPASMSYAEAAAFPNGALTAFTFLKKIGSVQRGQKVLIVGASGSVGSAAVQIAKHFGAEVTGVCSSRNAELVKSIGADSVIDYAKQDFTRNGEVYDIIYDTVGKVSFSRLKNSLTPNGTFLASAGGLGTMLLMLRTSLFGSKKIKAGISSESQEDLAFLTRLAEAGAIKPIIDRCYPLEAMVEAHRYVDTGRKKGNVVIVVTQDEQQPPHETIIQHVAQGN
ncbi:MAG: NAD(P)-dependent alcohol dehydrogenase [Anaerolineae bacterium]|nr:NAD(P)-dependent alcohol dehydrogenase [Anaerolineae bacterium]